MPVLPSSFYLKTKERNRIGKKKGNSKGGPRRLWILCPDNSNNWVKSRIGCQRNPIQKARLSHSSISFNCPLYRDWNSHCNNMKHIFSLVKHVAAALSFRYDSSLSSFWIYLGPCVSWWLLMKAEQFST